MGGRVLMASSMSRRRARDEWLRADGEQHVETRRVAVVVVSEMALSGH